MASVSEQLRKKVYGSANPSQSQINAVREKANTLAPGAQEALDRHTQAATSVQPASSKPSEPFWKTWFFDQGTNDTVVDSTTGQVIQVDKPSAAGLTGKGAAKRPAAGFTSAGSTILSALNKGIDTAENYSSDFAERQVRSIQKSLAEGKTSDGKILTPKMRETLLQSLSKYQTQAQEGPTDSFEERHPVLSSVQKSVESTADSLKKSSDADIAQAKEGLGTLGQFAVDVGVAGTQLAGDVGLALLTGGSALVPMAVRGFGSGAQEARQSGADLGNQLTYGAASAALSAATERISNVAAPFRKVFGQGVADKLAGKLVSRFGENTAVQVMNELSQTAAGRLAASALGEGIEEFVEDVFQPVLQRATYDPDARFDRKQARYDAAIGATLGGIGGAVEIAGRNTGSDVQAPTEPVQSVEAQAENIQPPSVKVNYDALEAQAIRKDAKTFRNLVAGFDTKVSDFFQKWREGRVSQNGDKLEKLYLGKMPESVRRQVSSILGYEVERRDFIVTNDDVKHVFDRHGDADTEIKGNNIPLEQWMFDALPDVVTSPDTIEPGKIGKGKKNAGKQSVIFRKAFPGGTVVTVQFDNKGRGTMEINTLYAKKNEDTSSKLDTAAGAAPNSTSETLEPVSSSDSIIAQGAEPVNSDPLPDALLGGNSDGLGAADAGSLNSAYQNLQAQSTRFYPEGANAARPVDVPMQDFSGRNVSKSASTVMGAKAIPDDVVPMIEQMVADGNLSYTVNTNQQAKVRAVSAIRRKGYDGALEQFRRSVNRGEVSKDTVALGQALLNNAANAKDGNAVAELMGLYQQLSTRTGQALQAMSIFRKLSPTSQLYGVQKMVENLNEAAAQTKKRRNVTAADNVPVEQWMTKTGELLAKSLAKIATPGKKKTQTVSQTILSDLRKFAKEHLPDTSTAAGGKRTDIDRIVDLFQNYGNYQEAFDAAKATIAKEYGENAQVQSVLDDWIQSTLDYNSMFDAQVAKNTGYKVQIDRDLIQKFLEQTDQAGRDAVMQEIYQNVADQVPSTWREKWNAWRYLSMLGNPRTHIRNIAGNIGFQPLRMVKNGVAAAIESGLESAGVQMERTKSFGVSPSLYRAAWNDYSNAKSVLSGSKYNDAKSQINDRRKIFSNSALEAARKGNSAALEFEDAIFKRITYAGSLAGYLKANGVTASQLESGNVDAGLLNRARDYAGQEALKATYQDRNKVSDSVVKIANDLGVVGEAILPFKRTPANILARAAEYSPIGVAKAIYDGAAKVKTGDKSIGEVIDEASAGLTGSGLLALGAYMFASGMVTGAQGDEKDDKWAELLGHQGYALELEDGTSITLDWLAPESLPFFMGVELMSSAGENGLDVESVWDALKATANPMLELSMLQSVNDLVESAQYAEDAPLSAMIPSAIVSYFSQAVPTLGGQIERTGESDRMTTYTDKNSAIPTDLQYAIGRASARIPGWDYQQIPYIDAWGRTESNGDPILNAANNFLNPAYTSQVEVDAVEAELQKVRDETGDTAVFPTTAQRYIEVDGERKDLTAEEYEKYARKLGTERYSLLQEAMQLPAYKGMSAQEKADYIADLYSYAGAVAKADVSSYQLDGWQENASTAQRDIGVSPAEYIALYQKYGSSIMSGKAYEKTKEAVASGITVEQYASAKDGMDANGNGSISQAEAQSALDQQDFTRAQKADLWTIINSSWKTNPYR